MNNLIKDITDNNIHVSNLLRRVKVLATNLNQPKFLKWVNQELNGYGEKDEYPDYRKVSGEVKFWNPQLGWCPVIFPNSNLEKQIANRYALQSVIELEELLSDSSSSYEMPYSATAANAIMKGADFQSKVSLFIGRATLKGILDMVRNSLLDWILRFEKEGINLETEKTMRQSIDVKELFRKQLKKLFKESGVIIGQAIHVENDLKLHLREEGVLDKDFSNTLRYLIGKGYLRGYSAVEDLDAVKLTTEGYDWMEESAETVKTRKEDKWYQKFWEKPWFQIIILLSAIVTIISIFLK